MWIYHLDKKWPPISQDKARFIFTANPSDFYLLCAKFFKQEFCNTTFHTVEFRDTVKVTDKASFSVAPVTRFLFLWNTSNFFYVPTLQDQRFWFYVALVFFEIDCKYNIRILIIDFCSSLFSKLFSHFSCNITFYSCNASKFKFRSYNVIPIQNGRLKNCTYKKC